MEHMPTLEDDESIPTLEEVGLTPEDVKLCKFDATNCLTCMKAVVAFLDEAARAGDAVFVAHCRGLVEKAAHMGKISGWPGFRQRTDPPFPAHRPSAEEIAAFMVWVDGLVALLLPGPRRRLRLAPKRTGRRRHHNSLDEGEPRHDTVRKGERL